MKRPIGFTFLSLLFTWFAVAGVAFAWVAPRTDPAQMAAFHLSAPIMSAIGITYGVTAGAVAISVWRMASWAPRAVLAWGATLFVAMLAFQAMIGVAGEPWWLVLLPYIAFGGLILALLRYVRRRSQSSPQAI
jgi:hypothetical protein